MSEARRLLERASQRAVTLTEAERNAYAVCLKYGLDVPASEVVPILESLAESRAREGELVAGVRKMEPRFRLASADCHRYWKHRGSWADCEAITCANDKAAMDVSLAQGEKA